VQLQELEYELLILKTPRQSPTMAAVLQNEEGYREKIVWQNIMDQFVGFADVKIKNYF
jgi:hypothetical protein